jgi:hypothetical protein
LKTATSILIAAAMLLTVAAPASAQLRSSGPQYKPNNWQEIASLPDFFTGTWLGNDNMVDGPLPLSSFTPAAKKYIASYKPVSDIRFAEAGCKTPGMPFVMQIAAMPLKFMVEPGMISIYIEGNSQVRFLRMRAKHAADVDRSFLGDSIAHWEGDTLVVDTIALRPETTFQYSARPLTPADGDNFLKADIFGPHGPNLRFVERMRLTGPNTLQIQTTTYDDTVFTQPKVTTRTYRRLTGSKGEPMEFVCEDGAETYDPVKNQHVIEDPEQALKDLEKEDK